MSAHYPVQQVPTQKKIHEMEARTPNPSFKSRIKPGFKFADKSEQGATHIAYGDLR
jgi:hypothetical protein